MLALARVVNGLTKHARMDLVFNLKGSITYLDVSIVAPFSCNPSLVFAASTKPGVMAKKAEKTKFDRYPHINLVPFILETTGRPGPHARKFINYLLRDADKPPIAVRDTWSTIQSVLHSAISKKTTHGSHYVTLGVDCHTQLFLNIWYLWLPVLSHRERTQPFFSFKAAAVVPCGPAVT